jgi:hypothetical protein
VNARGGSTARKWFQSDRDGGDNALRGKPGAGEFIRKRYAKARRMGGGDQFIGVGALSFPLAGTEVLALRQGTASRGDHAFTAPEIADPSGRGVWFHTDRFEAESGPGAPENKDPASRSNSREPLTRVRPLRRTLVGVEFVQLQPSRLRRDYANTLFLGSA